MGYFYSQETGGFYHTSLNPFIPAGAISITDAQYAALMDGQTAGRIITVDASGAPILMDRASILPTLTDAGRERDRRIAAGINVNVSGVVDPIPVSGRSADRANLTGIGLIALARLYAADTSPVRFRDADGTRQTLTPAQFMELIGACAAYIDALHVVVWDWEDGGTVPADFADDTHWP